MKRLVAVVIVLPLDVIDRPAQGTRAAERRACAVDRGWEWMMPVNGRRGFLIFRAFKATAPYDTTSRMVIE